MPPLIRRFTALPLTVPFFWKKFSQTAISAVIRQRKIVSSGSYQHTGIHAWFHEGHIQMKLRFPKLHKCVLLWPVLWVITFFCFLSNTYRIRHTTLRQTLADFRADNRKTKLLKIFDNNDLQ